MAVQTHAHPAIAAGLAGGIGLILPAAAYLATAPLDGAHQLVADAGVPFALGAAVGAGMCAAAMAALAASANARLGNRSEAGEYRFENEPVGEAAPEPELLREQPAKERTGFFRVRPEEDVPVIARAVDALSEAEAWAEIDKLLEDDSPVSCDPLRSKDIYEIAFAELAREAAPAPAAAAPAPASATAAFALASGAAEATAELTADGLALSDTDAAREAALASLGMPSTSEPSPAVAQVAAAGAVPADGDAPVPVAPAEPEEVPMADYSGHEGMWADALAILAEDAAPLAEPAEFAAEAGADEEVLASAPRVRAEEVPVNEERVEAIAEGERLTEMHGRVNEILSEEVAKVPSQSMRRTSHEYLRVIQGGTMAMPRLKAEA
ncbi:MAG: hypothetical protein E7001_03910 [Coriobacteriaceae bacterium]|nr:hypothetical protein [Coriobacteriaceae bacterium]